MQVDPQPPALTFSDQVRLEFLWKIDEYLSNYARFSDTKAAFIGATAISLLGWMLSQHLLSKVLQLSPAAWPAAVWFSATAALLLLGSMALTIWSVYPRLRSTRNKGIVFWADIATYANSAEYVSKMSVTGAEALVSELAQHIHDVASTICVPKFRYVSLAICFFVLGAISLGISLSLSTMSF